MSDHSDVRDEELRELVARGLLHAETDFRRVPEMDVIVICVPTPLTKNLTPDLRYVERVTRELAARLRPGQLVSLESTTYPGTTEEVMLPVLEASGLKVERDFFLVHSPERVDPGNKRYTTKNTCKVVSGVGPASLEVGVAFYSRTVERVVPESWWAITPGSMPSRPRSFEPSSPIFGSGPRPASASLTGMISSLAIWTAWLFPTGRPIALTSFTRGEETEWAETVVWRDVRGEALGVRK